MNEKFRDIDRNRQSSGDCGCGEYDEYDDYGEGRSRGRDCDEYGESRARGRDCDEYGEGRPHSRDCDECGEGRSRSRDCDECGEGGFRGDRRTELLQKIRQLNFMMIETGLFLNNQCDCEPAQVAFCDYQRRHAEAKAEYEDYYGPLTYEGVNAKSDGWSWVSGPWPWEVEDC